MSGEKRDGVKKKIIDEFVSMSYHSLHIQYINLRRPTYFESVLIPVLIYIYRSNINTI